MSKRFSDSCRSILCVTDLGGGGGCLVVGGQHGDPRVSGAEGKVVPRNRKNHHTPIITRHPLLKATLE